jgi:nitrate/TMAO reductase-like tetraheme cytochrome c subunit
MADNAKESCSQFPTNGRNARWKRRLLRLAIVLAAIVLLGTGSFKIADHHTSQSTFCASCHLMEPYYETWQADRHGELDIACVECHYAPGEQDTMLAKMRGLSQVMSYFAGRYGATRLRGFVSSDSCLTSKCHGNNAFMDKPVQFGSVTFVHSKHLERTAEQEEPNQQRLSELTAGLRSALSPHDFDELLRIATEVGPANDRYDALVALCQRSGAQLDRESLIEFSQLHHRGVRLAQLNDLQCRNCHSYHSPFGSSQGTKSGHHFDVRPTTCYTCHFNNEGFNTGTSTCLKCHSPPTNEITIHQELGVSAGVAAQSSELAVKPVTMNHADILTNRVDCLACHADMSHNDSVVTRRDCEQCHISERFFVDWKEPLTVDLVTRYHRAHIEPQRANCRDCHSETKHAPAHDESGGLDQGFLTSAVANCTHCHPKQHSDQLKLLTGAGGVGVHKSNPNPMAAARTNCYGCHTDMGTSAGGHDVMTGTQSSCVTCHGEGYVTKFEQWKSGIALTLADAELEYRNALQSIEDNVTSSAESRRRARELLAVAQSDLQLVKRGNGIHNVTYSIELLDSVVAHCQRAKEALKEK